MYCCCTGRILRRILQMWSQPRMGFPGRGPAGWWGWLSLERKQAAPPGTQAAFPDTRPPLSSPALGQLRGSRPPLMHFSGSECVLFIYGAESQVLSAQNPRGAWLLCAKGDKSFQYEPDRVGGIKGTQPESLFELPPRVAAAAPALQGNTLQRGHVWTAAGIIKDPATDT